MGAQEAQETPAAAKPRLARLFPAAIPLQRRATETGQEATPAGHGHASTGRPISAYPAPSAAAFKPSLSISAKLLGGSSPSVSALAAATATALASASAIATGASTTLHSTSGVHASAHADGVSKSHGIGQQPEGQAAATAAGLAGAGEPTDPAAQGRGTVQADPQPGVQQGMGSQQQTDPQQGIQQGMGHVRSQQQSDPQEPATTMTQPSQQGSPEPQPTSPDSTTSTSPHPTADGTPPAHTSSSTNSQHHQQQLTQEQRALLRRGQRRTGVTAVRMGTGELAWRLARVRTGVPPGLEDLPPSQLPAGGGDALEALATASWGAWTARDAEELILPTPRNIMSSGMGAVAGGAQGSDESAGAETGRRAGSAAARAEQRAARSTAQVAYLGQAACQVALDGWARVRRHMAACVIQAYYRGHQARLLAQAMRDGVYEDGSTEWLVRESTGSEICGPASSTAYNSNNNSSGGGTGRGSREGSAGGAGAAQALVGIAAGARAAEVEAARAAQAAREEVERQRGGVRRRLCQQARDVLLAAQAQQHYQRARERVLYLSHQRPNRRPSGEGSTDILTDGPTDSHPALNPHAWWRASAEGSTDPTNPMETEAASRVPCAAPPSLSPELVKQAHDLGLEVLVVLLEGGMEPSHIRMVLATSGLLTNGDEEQLFELQRMPTLHQRLARAARAPPPLPTTVATVTSAPQSNEDAAALPPAPRHIASPATDSSNFFTLLPPTAASSALWHGESREVNTAPTTLPTALQAVQPVAIPAASQDAQPPVQPGIPPVGPPGVVHVSVPTGLLPHRSPRHSTDNAPTTTVITSPQTSTQPTHSNSHGTGNTRHSTGNTRHSIDDNECEGTLAAPALALASPSSTERQSHRSPRPSGSVAEDGSVPASTSQRSIQPASVPKLPLLLLLDSVMASAGSPGRAATLRNSRLPDPCSPAPSSFPASSCRPVATDHHQSPRPDSAPGSQPGSAPSSHRSPPNSQRDLAGQRDGQTRPSRAGKAFNVAPQLDAIQQSATGKGAGGTAPATSSPGRPQRQQPASQSQSQPQQQPSLWDELQQDAEQAAAAAAAAADAREAEAVLKLLAASEEDPTMPSPRVCRAVCGSHVVTTAASGPAAGPAPAAAAVLTARLQSAGSGSTSSNKRDGGGGVNAGVTPVVRSTTPTGPWEGADLKPPVGQATRAETAAMNAPPLDPDNSRTSAPVARSASACTVRSATGTEPARVLSSSADGRPPAGASARPPAVAAKPPTSTVGASNLPPATGRPASVPSAALRPIPAALGSGCPAPRPWSQQQGAGTGAFVRQGSAGMVEDWLSQATTEGTALPAGATTRQSLVNQGRTEAPTSRPQSAKLAHALSAGARLVGGGSSATVQAMLLIAAAQDRQAAAAAAVAAGQQRGQLPPHMLSASGASQPAGPARVAAAGSGQGGGFHGGSSSLNQLPGQHQTIHVGAGGMMTSSNSSSVQAQHQGMMAPRGLGPGFRPPSGSTGRWSSNNLVAAAAAAAAAAAPEPPTAHAGMMSGGGLGGRFSGPAAGMAGGPSSLQQAQVGGSVPCLVRNASSGRNRVRLF